MEKRKLIGILLIVLSIALLIWVGSEIMNTITLSGLRYPATATYTPPFPLHGPLVVLGGVCAIALLIVGLHLLSPRKR